MHTTYPRFRLRFDGAAFRRTLAHASIGLRRLGRAIAGIERDREFRARMRRAGLYPHRSRRAARPLTGRVTYGPAPLAINGAAYRRRTRRR